MRILLIGVSGQVGWELRRSLQTLGDVVPAARRERDALSIDLTSPDSVRALIREIRPDLVVNAAAYTGVDRAEAEAAVARMVNADAVCILAEEAKACGAAVIHYSTDYVFDGRKTEPYREDDEPNPLNAYGRSKLEGELALAASGVAYLTLRTSWVYGARGRNFLLTIARLAREKESIRVVNDQVGAPTWSRLIAEATAQIVAQGRSGIGAYLRERGGVCHMTCAGRASWFDFAREILLGLRARQFDVATEVSAISTAEYPQAARRPACSVLDNARLVDNFGIRLPDWRAALDLVLDELGSV